MGRLALSLHGLRACDLGSHWGREAFRNNAAMSRPLQTPLPHCWPHHPVATSQHGTRITLLRMTHVMSPARDDRGAWEQYLHKTCFLENLNVKQDLQLSAQLLPGCEQFHSISPDPWRQGRKGSTSEWVPADADTLACGWIKSHVAGITRSLLWEDSVGFFVGRSEEPAAR